MVRACFAALALALLAACQTTPAGGYDAALAARTGADEGGMRNYVLVILKTGPANVQGAEREEIFRGHFANMKRMAEDGKLITAGPFGTNESQYRGLYLFAVSSVDEAQALAASDPAVKAGIFVVETYPWYGSAALMEIPALHKRLERPTP